MIVGFTFSLRSICKRSRHYFDNLTRLGFFTELGQLLGRRRRRRRSIGSICAQLIRLFCDTRTNTMIHLNYNNNALNNGGASMVFLT